MRNAEEIRAARVAVVDERSESNGPVLREHQEDVGGGETAEVGDGPELGEPRRGEGGRGLVRDLVVEVSSGLSAASTAASASGGSSGSASRSPQRSSSAVAAAPPQSSTTAGFAGAVALASASGSYPLDLLDAPAPPRRGCRSSPRTRAGRRSRGTGKDVPQALSEDVRPPPHHLDLGDVGGVGEVELTRHGDRTWKNRRWARSDLRADARSAGTRDGRDRTRRASTSENARACDTSPTRTRGSM